MAAGPKRQGGAGAKQRGRGGSTGAPSEKDEHGEGDPGAGLTEEEVGRREGEREKDGDERDREEDGDQGEIGCGAGRKSSACGEEMGSGSLVRCVCVAAQGERG